MRLTNKTAYDTAALRWVIVETHRRMAKTEGRLPQWRQVKVVVVPARRRTEETGYAYYRGTYTRLRIPRHGATAAQLAHLARHEFGHLYGWEHRGDMSGKRYHATDRNAEYAWAQARYPNGLPAKAAPRPRVPAVERRAAAAAANLSRWTRRLSFAKTMVRKYTRRVRYYEGRQGDKAALPKGGVQT